MPIPDQAPGVDTPQSGTSANGFPGLGKSPIHMLSAIVTMATDKLWDPMLIDMFKALPLPEKERFYLGSGLLLFMATAASTALTQHWVDKDPLGAALAKGVALGILAGLPYSFSTTELGLVFLGWSGINELQKAKK
jgi:hypothetical protein